MNPHEFSYLGWRYVRHDTCLIYQLTAFFLGLLIGAMTMCVLFFPAAVKAEQLINFEQSQQKVKT